MSYDTLKLQSLYQRYPIQREYDQQDAYDGKYPPDWDARKEAVWNRQDDRCGRCGRHRNDVSDVQVHHITFLSEGGGNELDNLAGLCVDCHSLMHPDNDDLDGRWQDAPLVPASDALPTVATVRKPQTEQERIQYEDYIEPLSAVDSPDVNAPSTNYRTVGLGTEAARRLSVDPERLCRNYNLGVPEGQRRVFVRYDVPGRVAFRVDDPTDIDMEVQTAAGTQSIEPRLDDGNRIEMSSEESTLRIELSHPKIEPISRTIKFEPHRRRKVVTLRLRWSDPGLSHGLREIRDKLMDYYRARGRGPIAAVHTLTVGFGGIGLAALIIAGPLFVLGFLICQSCVWASLPSGVFPEGLLLIGGLYAYAAVWGAIDDWYNG